MRPGFGCVNLGVDQSGLRWRRSSREIVKQTFALRDIEDGQAKTASIAP
jgi:hypothetical protein